jgi:hypothetical protein
MNRKLYFRQVIEHLSTVLMISSSNILQSVFMMPSFNFLDAIDFSFETMNDIFVLMHFIT